MPASLARPRPLVTRRRLGSVGLAGFVTVLSMASLAARGDDGPPLSQAGARGRELADENGCLVCHGSAGQGGVGPAWTGLAGSRVELDDGTVVIADDEYLRRSITDPGAQQVAGYAVSMPPNSPGPSDVDAIIAYMKDLR